MRTLTHALMLGCLVLALPALAYAEQKPVGIGSSKMMQVTVETADGPVVIERVQDNEAVIIGPYAMIREGYPADRIHYYRGGMQSWKVLGLTTVEGSL